MLFLTVSHGARKKTLNTPAHLILGATVFGKPGHAKVTLAAVVGSFLPDLSLYLMAGWALFVSQIPAEVVFDQFYFSETWQQVFAIDNSFVLWGVMLALALHRKSGWAIALTGAALLHLALDFPLHHDDARRHFWPIGNWVFHSPLSYWDHRHFGNLVGPVEILLSVGCCGWLWFRHQANWARLIIGLVALGQIMPGLIWAWVFATV